jgi:hypothetical protein
MFRCTCCGRWTVEVMALDRGRGRGRGGLSVFYRTYRDGRIFEEYLTHDALERELTEQGIFEYLVEVPDVRNAA